MTEPGAKPPRPRVRRYLLLAVLEGLLLLAGLIWYTTTDSFQAMVRHRMVAELEQITGGRVELGSFHTVPFHFQLEVRNLTIHGTEGAGEIPYAHVDSLTAHVKLVSLLGAEFGFHSLLLDRPVVHIISYPDGTTNQPVPKVKSTKAPLEQLFGLSIGRLEVRQGTLLWNEERIPVNFAANDVSIHMDYSLLRRSYNVSLKTGKIDTRFGNFRPVAWQADANFTLSGYRLDLKSLKATSERSQVQISGELVNFRQPTLTAKYDATVDLVQAGAILRRSEMRRGTVEISGEGSSSGPILGMLSRFSGTGKIALKDLEWRDRSLAMRITSANTQYALTPQRIQLTGLVANLLGGEASGDADILLSSASSGKGAGAKNSDEQRGVVRLNVRNLSAEEIATALASSARPFHQMNLVGAVNGSVQTRWRGSLRKAESEIALDAVAPTRLSPGQLPLNAHVRATYRVGPAELELDEFNASTRATQVRASGTLSSNATVKLAINTTDLGEWEPILDALGYHEGIPIILRGRASFHGTATGELGEIDFAGKLKSEDFDVLIPATSRTPAKETRWDSLVTDIQLSPHVFGLHNGVLGHDKTAISFDLSANLEDRMFVDTSPFSARLEMRNTDVSDILALAGYAYPVTGIMNLSLQASGTRADPQGQGHIELSGATIHGEPVQHFDSNLAFHGQQISMDSAHLTHGDATVAGDGTYNFSSHAFRYNLTGNNFDLAQVSQLETSRVQVEGRADFDAQGGGTLEEPTLNAKIRVHDLSFDHERAGDFLFTAVTVGPELTISGRSQFKDSELDIDGKVRLRGDWPSDLSLHFDHLDVDAMLHDYVRGQVIGHSAIKGTLQLQGPLRTPRELEMKGDITDFYADVDNIQVRNSGPINFSVSNQVLKLQQLRLTGQGTDLTASGTVELNGDHQLDLHANGNANLELIQSFNADFTSTGVVVVNLAVTGVPSKPVLQGRLQITGGSIAYVDLPSSLSDINGSLVFSQDRLQVETLTAHVGGGQVTFGGYATAYNRQLNFNLTLQTQDVRLRYPPGVSSMSNADLRWVGTSSSSTLSGDVTITKLAVTPGFDFGSYLERTAQSSALPQANPLLNRIRMDVHIVTTPELQMQTASVRLSGDADLRLRGTAAKPVLLGRADIIEGDIYFNGGKYRMERGDVLFANPVTTTPVLDLQASTHVRDYDITVNLNGEFDKLNLSYHSEPPLPTADIISLLAVGQTQDQSAQLQQSGQSPFAQQASSAVLAEALNSALSNRSQRLFGISHIKIDPQGLNTETTPTQVTPTPAVTIEQQVRDNITLTYSTNVAQTSQQIIQGEYNLTHNLSIVAIRDYNGVVSFEVRYRQRRK